ncbi:MAG: site-specific DNA-methyltransferase [Armatimonadetes bacterium]|nr:site-specific DNA-methyltransferase [Armatimonadota bacterium]
MAERDQWVAEFLAHIAALDLPRHHYIRLPDRDLLLTADLRGILRAELDTWLARRLLDLDTADALDLARAVREAARAAVEPLAEAEEARIARWQAPRAAVEEFWCVTLDRVPESLHAEIAGNAAQRQAWAALYGDDRLNLHAMVDTRLFGAEFTQRLLTTLGDAPPDGTVYHGDNHDALAHLAGELAGRVRCIYLDPPYNTGNEAFTYRDSYQRTVWRTMMTERLTAAREMLATDGAVFVSIDNNEQARLRLLMDEVFGERNFVETFLWTRTKTPPALAAKSRKTVEFVHCYERRLSSTPYRGRPLDNGDAPLLNTGNRERELTFPAGSILTSLPDGEYAPGPRGKVELLTAATVADGRIVNAITVRGPFKWQQSFLDAELAGGTTLLVRTAAFSMRFQRPDRGRCKPPGNQLDADLPSDVGTNESASAELRAMGLSGFSYPKPVSLVAALVRMNTGAGDIVLDFFAGSGTTGAAVLALNRADGLGRRYVLAELGDHVDTVLLPRLIKAVYAAEWRDGRPLPGTGVSHVLRVVRLARFEE